MLRPAAVSRGAGAVFVAALLLALIGGKAFAGPVDWVPLDREEGLPTTQRVRVQVESAPGAARPGAFGFMALRFENPTRDGHVVSAELSSGTDAGPVRIRRSLALPANEGAWLYVPLPSLDTWIRLQFSLDGGALVSARGTSPTSDARVAILGVHATDDDPWNDDWDHRLGAAGRPSAGSRGGPEVDAWLPPDALPADPALLSGIDLVLLTAPPSSLDDARQGMLVRYVAMGGHLAVVDREPAGEGPIADLRQAAVDEHASSVPHGFGSAFFFGTWDGNPAFTEWLRETALVPLNDTGRPFGSGAPTLFWLPLEIPGLGEVPARTFFLLLLAFAVVVGPVSYFVFKRRGVLAWLVAWIPTLGFLGAASVLLYGLLSEGLGARGAIRSLTLLDQRSHQATTVAGRTLYAGLSPGAVTPREGTFFSPWLLSSIDVFDPYISDAPGSIDGAVVPSRTPTPFLSVQAGLARERLRFRRRDDGDFEVLAAPDFAPVDAEGSVLLCTRGGTLYRMDATGRLRPGGDPDRSATALLSPLLSMPIDLTVRRNERRSFRGPYYPTRTPAKGFWLHAGRSHPAEDDFESWWAEEVLPQGLPPGSYLARMRSVPSLDGLGLDVRWEAEEHVVFGRLAEEDIVE